jgi:hypothetical protein
VKKQKIANFGTVEKKIITRSGAPSYTSGLQI